MLLIGQKAEVAAQEEVAKCAANLRSLLEKGSLAERKTSIPSFVKEVKITGDNASLTYTLPMIPSNKRFQEAAWGFYLIWLLNNLEFVRISERTCPCAIVVNTYATLG